MNDGQVTRIPDNPNHKATSIDLTLVSPDLAPKCSWSPWGDTLNSDHFPLLLTIEKEDSHPVDFSEDKIPKFNYKNADWEKYYNILLQFHFDDTHWENHTVDKLYTIFHETIIQAASNSIPLLKAKKIL